jgi:asparagine N-glycosylation enzyme membrane subunit Stt3
VSFFESVLNVLGSIASTVFAGLIYLGIFTLGIMTVYIVLSGVIKKPKESLILLFWVVMPYISAAAIIYVFHGYIGGWSYLAGIFVWGVLQNHSIDKDEDKKIE